MVIGGAPHLYSLHSLICQYSLSIAAWSEMASGGDGADLQEAILLLLDVRGTLDSWEYSVECSKDHQVVVGAIKSLESLGEVRM